MRFLLLAFVVIPIIEMYFLIKVGQWLGAWPTIGLVLLTAIVGAALLRQQGFATLSRSRERLAAGQLPAREMAEGLLLAVGGALLLTPGFVTDAFGFLCLLPPTRKIMARALLARGMKVQGGPGVDGFRAGSDPFSGPDPHVRRARDGSHVIDGEFSRQDDDRTP